jgi:hypothetical protein
MQRIRKKLGWGIFFLVFLTNCLYAQSDLFRSVSTPALNTKQNTRYQKVLNASHLKNHRFIKLENLATTQSEGKLNIRLSGICNNLVFKARNVEYTSENDYYWYGDIQGDEEGPCFSGSITLIAKDGEKYGQIRLDERLFEWQDLGDNLQIISEYDNEIADADCRVDEHTQTGRDPIITEEDILRTGCQGTGTGSSSEPRGTVRVLVLFTPAAAANEPNINNRANLAIQQSNQIYANSQILSQNARLVLAGAEVFNFVETPRQMNADVQLLRNNLIAQARRDATNADLVVLMTNGDYAPFNGVVARIGPDNANGYAIVQINDATSNQKVFAHEIGHLFGGRHDEFDPDATYDRGYIFNTGFLNLRKNYTIMTRFGSRRRGRIDHFSNPNVRYKNKATGTSDRNNARRLNETGNTIAAFRPPITVITPSIPFSVTVSAPATYPACSRGGCVTATITCGIAPFTIRWENSSDGITWRPTTTTTTGYCFVTPCSPGGQFWVRITVTDSQGNIRQAGSIIELIDSNSGSSGLMRVNESNIITNIYPNPFVESTQITLNLPETETIAIEISNMYGTLRKSLPTQVLSAGQHIISIPRNNLPQGLYFIKLSTNSGYTEIKNVVINP